MPRPPVTRPSSLRSPSIQNHPLAPWSLAIAIALSVAAPAPAQSQSAKSATGPAFNRLLDREWEQRMLDFPEWATSVGHPGENHRWTDESLRGIEKRKLRKRDFLKKLQAINPDDLPKPDRLTHALLMRDAQVDVAGFEFPSELMPIDRMGGPQTELMRMIGQMPREGRKDYEDIISRLEAIPTLLSQVRARMEAGMKQGIMPPAASLAGIEDQITALTGTVTDDNPFLEPFKKMPASLGKGEADTLRQKARAAVKDKVVPAFYAFQGFFHDIYLPAARPTIAITALPNGKRWYEHAILAMTTTGMDAEEIHQLGLREVERIRAEMLGIMAELGFKGSFSKFSEFLRSDPRFFHASKEELLREYRDIAKRADGELPKLFKQLPRLPYTVLPVPAYMERQQTTAYYEGGAIDARRPGVFFANTYDLKSRPRWEMEALTLHEAVPGHHLQIALAEESEGLHKLRQHLGFTAFVEGWGLYAESLGTMMGFYQDPYARFGQLTYEMWRAVRLVVDTGIHAKDWSRQRAIDYFMEHASKTLHDVTVEVDRYICWPGQALAYKLGELKIKELRAFAEKELGPAYDIREFHYQVLREGSLPLDVLAARIQAWVAEAKAKRA